ncbi:hypothetical protein GHT06_018623 [Daphnia sinensis]|uniref:DDE Tnp4 domain-containing protein n=1 Tax=Daphnia sinensis TaxID=1820382 RepID=A0AAD5KMN0_9CRUS|nr:hypothetical protein GHT06_018623 [Daphnia sinensis]
MGRSIPVEQRLALTLRFLASGDCMRSLSYAFRIGHSTVSEIVRETCEKIFETLSPIYLKQPDTNEWKKIANDNSGSTWYNYKGFHSMVMFAICDANYCFTVIDIGAYGREGDAGIFASSQFAMVLENGSLGIPHPSLLVYSDVISTHVFVMDDAFPLMKNIMKPCPGRSLGTLLEGERTFNYRLSRARRTVENAFGIIVSKLRIFSKPNHCYVYKSILKIFSFVTVIFHLSKGSNYTTVAKNIRNQFKEYFMKEGAVPWQSAIVNETGMISEEEDHE